MFSSAIFPLLLGITHCFEADHILAVSMVNTKQARAKELLYQGFTWGIGHSIPVLVIGLLYTWLRVFVLEGSPINLEIPVGILLIAIGLFRLLYKSKQGEHHYHHLKAMLFVGLIHGLAGSAGIILLHVAVTPSMQQQILYLLTFSLGSILGMGVICVLLFNVTNYLKEVKIIQWIIPLLSIIYGIQIIYNN